MKEKTWQKLGKRELQDLTNEEIKNELKNEDLKSFCVITKVEKKIEEKFDF